ncbi:enoyl-CoA hydratase/isomerase family protein [Myxococcota bacterium]|nr:enoyl-CoA hydratase/isomerase family protein [Myxococcota bacterium]
MAETADLGTPFLRYEREGHIALCTIDRPSSKNALSSSMYYGIKKAVALVNTYEEPTALIITGTGDVFAPGGELRGVVEDPNPNQEYMVGGDIIPFEEVRMSFAPVISAVNGMCWGGGLLTAMMSDIAVCSERATFRVPELVRGIADMNYAAYLPAHVGVAVARDMMLSGRIVSAEEALRIGLISRVVAHEDLMEESRKAAEEILRSAPEARMFVKRALTENYGHVDRMSFHWSLWKSGEAHEGMRAFAEKRSPEWVPTNLRTGRL